MLQQFEIGRRRRLEIAGMAHGKSLERLACALLAEILRDRALDVLHGDRRAPAPEGRRDRRQRLGHENIGLQMLDRRRPPRQRQHDVGEDVEREAPQHAVQQGRQVGAEQRLRAQRLDAERAVLQHRHAGGRAVEEARQEQRVGPHRDADHHAAHGAARGRLPPEQPAEKGRRELRDRGKGQ
jgi:hypothetical protein